MLSLKLLGAVFVVAAATGWGQRLAQALSYRVELLTDLIFALQALESEILYAVSPLPKAAVNIGKTARTQEVKDFFTAFGSRLPDSLITTDQLWVTTAESVLGSTPLKPADLEVIKRLGLHLGRSDRQDQLKHLNQVKAGLESELIEAKDLASKYEGLYRKLGLTAGLIVVLLSW